MDRPIEIGSRKEPPRDKPIGTEPDWTELFNRSTLSISVGKEEEEWRAPTSVNPNDLVPEEPGQLFQKTEPTSPSDNKPEPEMKFIKDKKHKNYTPTNLPNEPRENNQAL